MEKRVKYALTAIIIMLILFSIEGFLFIKTVTAKDFKYWDFDVNKNRSFCEQNLPFDKNKKSIVVFGDWAFKAPSYPEEDTFCYKLQKLTGQKVYNKGMVRTGAAHMLWTIENSDFFKNPDLNPEYVIYLYLPLHLRRLYTDYDGGIDSIKYLRYKKTKNGLEPMPINEPFKDFFRQLQVYRRFVDNSIKRKTRREKFDFMLLHLQQAKEALNKKYPQAKFVVVIFDDYFQNSLSIKNFQRRLKEGGFIVIDFSSERYNYLRLKGYYIDFGMPNGKFWDEVTPMIIEGLKNNDKNDASA